MQLPREHLHNSNSFCARNAPLCQLPCATNEDSSADTDRTSHRHIYTELSVPTSTHKNTPAARCSLQVSRRSAFRAPRPPRTAACSRAHGGGAARCGNAAGIKRSGAPERSGGAAGGTRSASPAGAARLHDGAGSVRSGRDTRAARSPRPRARPGRRR